MKEAYDLMDRLLRSSTRRKVWKREELRELILKSVLEMQQEQLQSMSAPTTLTITGALPDATYVETVGEIEKEDLRTSEEWDKVCKIRVLVPDGWDRRNLEYSMLERITREEYERRLLISTIELKSEFLGQVENLAPHSFIDHIWIDKDEQ